MPRIPSPINWLRQRNQPDDFLMTYSEMILDDRQKRLEDREYSQIMRPDAVKNFLYNLVDTWVDSLAITTVNLKVKDGGLQVYDDTGAEVREEVERFMPQWNNGDIAIFFKGLDPNSSDDDYGLRLGGLMPDADLDVVRSEMWETIDKYLTPPIQVNSIKIYQDNSTSKVLFRPLNPINLHEMFGLEELLEDYYGITNSY